MTLHWPPILPQRPLAGGFSEQFIDPVLRTEMDQGPAKVRLLEAKPSAQVAFNFRMSAQQYSWFKAWWVDQAKYGAAVFLWQNPDTLEVNEYRAIGQYQGSATPGQRGLFYDVAMVWERLP